MIAQLMPNTNQFYVATKEDLAEDWLKKSDKLARDARLFPNGEPVIDMDYVKSKNLMKYIKHFPNKFKKQVEHSFIIGCAASPSGTQGMTGINIVLDEFARMNKTKTLQKDLFNAIRYFISQGGQMTIQSVPLVRSDWFWKLYDNAPKYMLSPYYCPIIENWEEIDLNKDLRNQKLKIPYWWTDINELEQIRRADLDSFKQEVLGIPADILYRFIPPELWLSCIDSTYKFRNDNQGFYRIGVDIGQKRDTTVATVGEIIGDHIWERYIYESQKPYNEQIPELIQLCEWFKPIELRIDNTGVGVPISDALEGTPGMPPIKRIEFASYIELEKKKTRMPTYLSECFKNMLLNKQYHAVENSTATQHVLRVEKIVTDANVIRFTGKKGNQRDDHYWSKAILAASFDMLNRGAVFSVPKEKTFTSKGDKRRATGVQKLKSNAINQSFRENRGGSYLAW